MLRKLLDETTQHYTATFHLTRGCHPPAIDAAICLKIKGLMMRDETTGIMALVLQ
jgi:hypothetical protein